MEHARMDYRFTAILITMLMLLAFFGGPAHSKNEYLGDNWRDCDSGHIEPYAEISKRDVDYSDNSDENKSDDEIRVGVRFRFKIGNTCDKKFKEAQESRYQLQQQIELLKICRKYKSVEMGPELELVAKKCRDMKFLKKEDKRKRTDDDLFDELMKIEHKKQMELKDTNGLTKE
jgi:hypothetical protein